MARRKTEKLADLQPAIDPYLLEAEACRHQEGGNFVFYHPGVEKNCIAIGGGVMEECGIPGGYEYDVASWSGYGACAIRKIVLSDPEPEPAVDDAAPLNFDDPD